MRHHKITHFWLVCQKHKNHLDHSQQMGYIIATSNNTNIDICSNNVRIIFLLPEIMTQRCLTKKTLFTNSMHTCSKYFHKKVTLLSTIPVKPIRC